VVLNEIDSATTRQRRRRSQRPRVLEPAESGHCTADQLFGRHGAARCIRGRGRPGGQVNPPDDLARLADRLRRRADISGRRTLILAALALTTGCASHRMAITGAVCGVVTGPVSCVSSAIRRDATPLWFLPVSPLLGVFGGWEFGGFKDHDFEEYGSYTAPGTYRLRRVFEPLLGFPLNLYEDAIEPGLPPLRASFLRLEGGCRSILVDELSEAFGIDSPIDLDVELTRLLRLRRDDLQMEAAGEPGDQGGLATLVYSALHGAVEGEGGTAWRRILLEAQSRLEGDPNASLSSREIFEAHFALVSPACRQAWIDCLNRTPPGVHSESAFTHPGRTRLALKWVKPTATAPNSVRLLAVRVVDVDMLGFDAGEQPYVFKAGAELDAGLKVYEFDSYGLPGIPVVTIETDQGPIVRVFPSIGAGFVRRKPEASASATGPQQEFEH